MLNKKAVLLLEQVLKNNLKDLSLDKKVKMTFHL